MDTNKHFEICRQKAFNTESRKILLARITDSEQEKDLTIPPNCDGYGRIRHFKRILDDDWRDPLPMDPMAKALNLPYEDIIKAQVFQIAVCNIHCWYCFVPDNLKAGKATNASWFTSEQIVKMFMEDGSKDVRLIDLSGGNPELAPEWILDTMQALEKYNLNEYVYLWSDDTLTTDFFFTNLSKSEIQYINKYRNYGKVGCFKGFDEESFAFNTNLDGHLFEKQFEFFERYLDIGLDMYGYVTFTSLNIDDLEEKVHNFINRLRKIHPLLPLRIIPLKIVMFTPTEQRMHYSHQLAIDNQFAVHLEWRKQLRSIFSSELMEANICDILL